MKGARDSDRLGLRICSRPAGLIIIYRRPIPCYAERGKDNIDSV
jgi:hypothetical protein